MALTERTINNALADLLSKTRYAWHDKDVVVSESTQQLAESKLLQPDILIREPFEKPVVIETELLPASTVEADALQRLGKEVVFLGAEVTSVIAVRMPSRLKEASRRQLKRELRKTDDFQFALFFGENPDNFDRYPTNGWLTGGIHDLSQLVQSASIPPSLVEEAAKWFEMGINQAADHLKVISENHPVAVRSIAAELHQQDSIQTRRMAMAILINAFIFHGHLAGGHGELGKVRTLAQLEFGDGRGLQIAEILANWEIILRVNYWPIFDIAYRILRVIPNHKDNDFIRLLVRTAEALLSRGLQRSHDITGTVFQKLIADRKLLAAFYTKPASAALLVALAVTEDSLLDEGDWSKSEAVSSLRIADFACGTGTLLSTVYQRVSQLHELHGGNAEAMHARMMARALVGCDILPAAAHLTAASLALAHPYVQYHESAIFTAPFGVQPDGKIKLGSIDLLRDMALLEGSEITAKAIEATKGEEVDIWRYAPHESFDMVIMNPPFGRDTNHEGQRAGIPHPVYAALGTSDEDQKAMADAAKRLAKGTVHNGHAGVATTFMALADKKLRIDGMLALVMPLTLLSGSSWEKCRNQLRETYADLIVISIADVENASLSFSADTGMGDCLIIGKRSGRRQFRATFVILNEAPSYSFHSLRAARQIRQLIRDKTVRRLEDGPTGGSAIYIGDEIVGQAIDAPLPSIGGWKLGRIVDLSLAQSAFQLASISRLWLPTQMEADTFELPITTVKEIGQIGPSHRNVNRKYGGPFDLRALQGDTVPTYPILWAHDAERERTLMFEADHDGIPHRPGSRTEQALIDRKIDSVFATASHCHSNLDFRFNSQSTAMQFTTRKTIGGRAWISIQLPTEAHEKALALWANTLPGLLMFWWQSSRQQPGRGILTKSTLKTLPILDITALTPTQLATAASIFDDTCQLPLKPLHKLHIDHNRKLIDRRFYGEVLGLPAQLLQDGGPLDILRTKLSREPSIRGAK